MSSCAGSRTRRRRRSERSSSTASRRPRPRSRSASSASSTSRAPSRPTRSASNSEEAMADPRPPPAPRPRVRLTLARLGCARMLAVVASFAPAVAAQDDRAPTLDYVSVQDRAGFLEAVNRIAQGDERGGIRTLEEIAQRFGDDPDAFIVHYNLACGHARLKEIEPGFVELARAIELGYAI